MSYHIILVNFSAPINIYLLNNIPSNENINAVNFFVLLLDTIVEILTYNVGCISINTSGARTVDNYQIC